MSRESPGAQMVPSGVSIQNPQQSSGSKMRSLAPGDALCQAWSAGMTSTRTGPTRNARRCRDRTPGSLPASSAKPRMRRVVLTGDPGKITTGGNAVVVVVTVRDEHGFRPGHVVDGDRGLDHYRPVETGPAGGAHSRH